MLRLGLALGSTSVRAALLAQPRLLPHSTVLSATTGIYTPCRTMAAKQKEQSAKKQRYSTKDTIKHKRVKSGLRHKRVSWLDSPRVKTISRKKKPLRHRLHTLNTDKRLTHYVNRLKKDQKEHPTRRPNETWYEVYLHPFNPQYHLYNTFHATITTSPPSPHHNNYQIHNNHIITSSPSSRSSH